jgi:signal transduction histidine kinase
MSGLALHEFLSQNRAEILAMSVQQMKSKSPERQESELAAEFDEVLDEIVRALQVDAGLPASSPLPGKSAAATRHGARRQRRGDAIEKLALDFGAISNAMGSLGARLGLSFEAKEYRVFNACIDTAIASALEQFSDQEHRQQQEETAQRIGFLAHELRNSLATVRMAFNILLEGQLGIRSKTGTVLERGLTRLESLINQTLLAVQLQGGVALHAQRMRVIDLLFEIRDTIVPERDITFEVAADDALEAEVDERLVISAIGNLAQNAFKFTRTGGHVIMRARADDESIVIEVEDECGGLPPGKEAELFQPYVQRGSDRRGLGLGLAITRDAVAAHGGEVSVRNLPGKGCIFSVVLPRSSMSARSGVAPI